MFQIAKRAFSEVRTVAEWSGICPICERAATFRAYMEWFRDGLLCMECNSIPRERAMMLVLERERPNWRTLRIHESSPAERAASLKLKRECRGYLATQFFPETHPGTFCHGIRCEDLERQMFSNDSFDIVITQDVMEHVFDPAAAYREIWRTLRTGGVYIHTTPINKTLIKTIRCAEQLADGSVHHLRKPEYHGNPIGDGRSLVTFLWGYDLPDLIAEWTPFEVEVRRFNDRTHGIVAEYSEVIVCQKR